MQWSPGIIACLIIAGCARGPLADPASPPDQAWLSEIFSGYEPLENPPVVTATGDPGLVTVSNNGKTTLGYYAAGRSGIQLFQERDAGGRWKLKNWDWCGTGKEAFTIAPGESVTLEVKFWDKGERERMLGWFVEPETLRGSMVALASEP